MPQFNIYLSSTFIDKNIKCLLKTDWSYASRSAAVHYGYPEMMNCQIHNICVKVTEIQCIMKNVVQ